MAKAKKSTSKKLSKGRLFALETCSINKYVLPGGGIRATTLESLAADGLVEADGLRASSIRISSKGQSITYTQSFKITPAGKTALKEHYEAVKVV